MTDRLGPDDTAAGRLGQRGQGFGKHRLGANGLVAALWMQRMPLGGCA